MRFAFVPLTAALALALASPVAAAAQTDFLGDLLTEITKRMANMKLAPTGWEVRGQMAARTNAQQFVELEPDRQYVIVGVCDNECGDLNLKVSNANGLLLNSDDKADDTPIVVIKPADKGRYTLDVAMVACKSASCSYSLKAYVK